MTIIKTETIQRGIFAKNGIDITPNDFYSEAFDTSKESINQISK